MNETLSEWERNAAKSMGGRIPAFNAWTMVKTREEWDEEGESCRDWELYSDTYPAKCHFQAFGKIYAIIKEIKSISRNVI